MYLTFALKQDKNCPVFIDGVIHDSFYPGSYDDSMQGDWHYADPGTELAKLPEKLVLVTKDKPYELDFRSGFKGHIVSERFLNVFHSLKTGKWEIAQLEIVNPRGVQISQNKYFFMRQKNIDKEPEHIIDKIKSNIEFRKSGEIKHISSLVIKESTDLDYFSINEISLFRRIFLSPAAADKFNALNMKGFEIVGLENIGSVKTA